MSIVDVADEIVPAANEITLVDVGISDKKFIYLLQEIWGENKLSRPILALLNFHEIVRNSAIRLTKYMQMISV